MANYDVDVVVDNTGNPQEGVAFDFYDTPGGTIQPITDQNGTPLAHIVSNVNGVTPRFQTALLRGYIGGGGLFQPVLSLEAQDGSAAAAAAQAAATAATNASSAAQAAQTNAAAAATSSAASAAIAQAQPGVVTIVQNADGTWPSRLTVTTDRTRVIFYLVLNSALLPTTAPVVTSGIGLTQPTINDQFIQSA